MPTRRIRTWLTPTLLVNLAACAAPTPGPPEDFNNLVLIFESR